MWIAHLDAAFSEACSKSLFSNGQSLVVRNELCVLGPSWARFANAQACTIYNVIIMLTDVKKMM